METECTPQKVLNKIKEKSIIHNIFRIRDDDSNMWGFYCTPLIKYMLARKTFLDSTNLVCPNDYKKRNKSILTTNMSSIEFR